ncbi:MAG: BamA/TamA family outer membrane protein [Pseudomonadota bacterium]|nr:BamA/TamA family outer membrane protein [Pseudomonadota bacterium]
MANKYRIIILVFLLSVNHVIATTEFIINRYHISLNSNLKEANTNVINGLKNYFSRYDKLSQTMLDSVVDDSQDNIRKSLEVFGFFSPSIKYHYKQSNGKIFISYDIKKGQQVIVNGLDITISDQIIKKAGLQKDLKALHALNNKPYDGIELSNIKDNILEKVRRNGYPFAEFNEAAMSFINPIKIVLKFKLNLNKYYSFGDITIVDSKNLKDSFIKSYANFKKGDDYDTLLIGQFQKDLISSGFFDQVNVYPINWLDQTTEVPITVSVVDAKPWSRSYSIGYDDKYHIGGSVGYQVKPYNSRGHILEFFLRLATNDYIQLKTNYIVPSARPLERIYLYSSQIITQNLNVGEAESGLLTAALQQKYKDWLVIPGINMFIEHSMPNNESNYTTKLIYPQLNLLYKVKNPYAWLDRFQFSTSAIATDKGAFSGISLSRGTIKSEALFPVADRLNFLLTGGVGALSSSSLDDVPLSLKFYAGGPDSIRGYAFNEFGPGKYEKNLSYELQYSLSSLVEPFCFIDQGSASDKWDDKMKSSIGIGIMFNFKVVGLKFSLARGLDEEADPYKIQFSVQSMS